MSRSRTAEPRIKDEARSHDDFSSVDGAQRPVSPPAHDAMTRNPCRFTNTHTRASESHDARIARSCQPCSALLINCHHAAFMGQTMSKRSSVYCLPTALAKDSSTVPSMLRRVTAPISAAVPVDSAAQNGGSCSVGAYPEPTGKEST